MMSIPQKLRNLRKNSGITVGALADSCGVSQAFLSQIEGGVRKPKVELLEKLAAALGVSAAYFFDETPTGESCIPVEISARCYRIPIYNITCSAGTFRDHPEACVDEYQAFSVTVCPDKDAGAIRVKGDSMAPEVLDGDLVFFSRDRRIKRNDLVVVMVDNEGLALKRYQPIGSGDPPEQVALISANPKYPARVVLPSEIVAIHKVIGMHRSLL